MSKNHTYRIGDPMSKGTFEAFIRHFPNRWLREAGVERPAFYAVAHGLIEVGDFQTGENFRLSQVAISEITGVSTKSVRKVTAVLEKTKAIEVAELSRRPGGGKPVKNYKLVYSKHVHDVITTHDRDFGLDEYQNAKGTTAPLQREPQPYSMRTTTPINSNHNPIKGMSTNENKNHHTTPQPSAGVGGSWVDEELSEVGARLLDLEGI